MLVVLIQPLPDQARMEKEGGELLGSHTIEYFAVIKNDIFKRTFNNTEKFTIIN